MIREALADPNVRYPADTAAGGLIVASWAGYLPTIAAIIGILYYCLLVYDWVEKRVQAYQAKKASDPKTAG